MACSCSWFPLGYWAMFIAAIFWKLLMFGMTLFSGLCLFWVKLSHEILIQEFGIGTKCELSHSFLKCKTPFQNPNRNRTKEQRKSVFRKNGADIGTGGKGKRSQFPQVSWFWFHFFLGLHHVPAPHSMNNPALSYIELFSVLAATVLFLYQRCS